MSVLSTADRVIEATGELQELRSRLAELDAERAVVEKRIESLLAEIGTATHSAAPAAGSTFSIRRHASEATTSEKIISMLENKPDGIFNTLDIAKRWNDVRRIDVYRSALSRLSSQGKIRRIRQGWYSAMPPKVKT